MILLLHILLNYAFPLGNIAVFTGSMAYVANPVIERNAIVFVHAYSYKRIRRSILLDVRASFFISLEWVYALSVYFLNLVIRMNCT